MADREDERSKTPDEPTRPTTLRHDRTGGPMTGRMQDHDTWALQQVKNNHAARQAGETRHQQNAASQAKEGQADPSRQAEPKKLRTFEQRHPNGPDRAILKREHAAATKPQPEKKTATTPARPSDAQQPSPTPRQPGPPQQQSGARPQERSKELRKFEDRNPPGQDHARGR